MGTSDDMRRRNLFTRTDDNERARLIAEARSLIYDKNHAVGNEKINALLSQESLTPTMVSTLCDRPEF